MATFGKTANGGGENQDGGGIVRGCRFRLFESGTITALTMRARVNTAGTVKLKMAIYSDSAGAPNAPVATSQEISITNTSDAAVTATVSPGVNLSAAYYWLVFTNDGGTGGGGLWFREDTLTNGVDYVGNTYPTFPNPFNFTNNQDFSITIYATYTQTSSTVVALPVAGANSPADGWASRFGVDESLSAIRSNAGNIPSVVDTNLIVQLRSSATTNQFSQLYKAIMNFDTSAIPDGAVVTSAVLSLYVNAINTPLGTTGFSLVVIGATPAGTSNIVNGDYNQLGSTLFDFKNYTSVVVGAYNDFTFNATGLATINKTGVTSVGATNGYDYNNVFNGTWTSSASNNYLINSADLGYFLPTLTVTYSIGGSFLMNFV